MLKPTFQLKLDANLQTSIDRVLHRLEIDRETLTILFEDGATWLRINGKMKQIRHFNQLEVGAELMIYYNPKLLQETPPEASEIYHEKEFGIWFKPTGLLCQGSPFGDRFSILRQVLTKYKYPHLVHRLDREVQGLLIIAYKNETAGYFSKIWETQVQKFYTALVLGRLPDDKGEITFDLEGKKAHTSWKKIREIDNNTLVEVELHTGRNHQIRKHFEMINAPIIGDPLYGRGNKNRKGLMLEASKLVINEKVYLLSKKYTLFPEN